LLLKANPIPFDFMNATIMFKRQLGRIHVDSFFIAPNLSFNYY